MTDELFVIKEKLAGLESALKNRLPDMPVILRDIHKILKADPEVVTLLSEHDKKTIVSSLIAHTNTTITTTQLKATKTRGKAIKDIGVGDL